MKNEEFATTMIIMNCKLTMLKRYILTLVLTSFSLWLMAVPAMRIRRSVTLDDGRTVVVTAYGDEFFDYLLTDDGEVVVEQDGTFHPTGLSVYEYYATLPPMPRQERRRVGSVATALVQPYGTKKIPVILAAFKDKNFSVGVTESRVQSFYNRFFNGTDIYSTTGNWGSVRQYFIDQSEGQFQPEFTIIGPVQLDSIYSYYGEQSGGTKDLHYYEFVSESFSKAYIASKDTLTGGWLQFDNDGDGKVDMCVIIFAGLGQNYTNSYGDKNTLWPQEMPCAYTIDGVTLSGCSSSCELRPTAASADGRITDTQPDGVGVVIHEVSHSIGLPDLYDTKNVAFGLDYWSVMDYGMYTRSGKVPIGYTAYEREFMGWKQTEVIKGPSTLHLSVVSQGGKGYKLVNDANPNEYYILENKQPVGWDWGVCSNRGHGMLVFHVDYNAGSWLGNAVNTSVSHQRLTIIPANNSLIGSNNAKSKDEWQRSLQGNPYPGITENHELTDTSTPASLVFTGTYMGKPLVDIEETEDGIITVKAMPLGTLEPPTGLALEDTEPLKTTAIWEPIEGAELYNLRLWCEGQLVLQQDSIGATSFRFDNLKEDVDYTFAVQSISDSYRNSKWAEGEPFRANPDAISEITESSELVRVYKTDGRMVGECFADELHRFSLRHGIYVVRRMDGRTKKIMIQ